MASSENMKNKYIILVNCNIAILTCNINLYLKKLHI